MPRTLLDLSLRCRFRLVQQAEQIRDRLGRFRAGRAAQRVERAVAVARNQADS